MRTFLFLMLSCIAAQSSVNAMEKSPLQNSVKRGLQADIRLALSGRGSSVQFNHAGTHIIITSLRDKSIKIYDARTGHFVKELIDPTNVMVSAEFNHEGDLVLGIPRFNDKLPDTALRIWNVSTGLCVQCVGHTKAITAATFSKKDRLVATASLDGTARIWNSDTGTCLAILAGHTGPVFDIGFNHEGCMLATASADHTVRTWDVSTGTCLKIFQGHSKEVRRVSFNRQGDGIVTAADDSTARVFDVSSGNCIHELNGNTGLESVFTGDGKTSASVFNHRGNLIATAMAAAGACTDTDVYLWDALTGKRLHSFTYTDRPDNDQAIILSHDIAFNRCGNRLACADLDTLNIYDTSTGARLHSLERHRQSREINSYVDYRGERQSQTTEDWTGVSQPTFNRAGNRLAVVLGNGRIHIWHDDRPRLRMLLFLCAHHARLGAQSPASILPTDLMRRIYSYVLEESFAKKAGSFDQCCIS